MQQQFCHSCGMPLNLPDVKARGNYCNYCSDEAGNLYPKETVIKGLAGWLKSFSPHQDANFARWSGLRPISTRLLYPDFLWRVIK